MVLRSPQFGLPHRPRPSDRVSWTSSAVGHGGETVERAEIDVVALDEIEVWRSGTATDGDVGDR